jgi:DNA polymerase III subunit epsilon
MSVGEELGEYRRARFPRRRTPWRDAGWCAVDLELTGLDPECDEIISFGAVPIDHGRVRVGGAVSGLARPIRPSSDESIVVHGIREIDLAQAPALEVAILPLVRAITGRVLVVHNADVERPFLERALRGLRLRLRNAIADTEVVGRVWLHEREGVLRRWLALADLAAELGVPAERPHDALGDALTTAQIFIALATHLEASHAETVSTLVNASRRLDTIRIFHLG